jgi:hypothetical protein
MVAVSGLFSSALMYAELHCERLDLHPFAVALSRQTDTIYVHITLTRELDAARLAEALGLDELGAADRVHLAIGPDDLDPVGPFAGDVEVNGQRVSYVVAVATQMMRAY